MHELLAANGDKVRIGLFNPAETGYKLLLKQ